MNRWDIINHFIEKNGYKSYLEIGYYKGWSFDQVKCTYKMAVDPNPCKTSEQENMPINSSMVRGSEVIYKATSDEFFKNIKFKVDVIFIDGLHEANQVMKDIKNAMNHINDGGIIILHDCNPPEYEHTTTGINGAWTGDVYKAFIGATQFLNDDQYYVVDTDWGVGIIHPDDDVLASTMWTGEWEDFKRDRKKLLNLISVEEFKSK